jgi:hypothetical protein
LATYSSRLPRARDVLYVLAAGAFPIHLRAILVVLRYVPAWAMRMNGWELAATVAYTQALALFDSLLVLGCLVLVSAILPARWFREKFLAVGSMAALATAFWAMSVPVLVVFATQTWGVRTWPAWLAATAAYLGLVAVLSHVIRHRKRAEDLAASLAGRLVVISYLYLLVGVLGLLIVIIRNVG